MWIFVYWGFLGYATASMQPFAWVNGFVKYRNGDKNEYQVLLLLDASTANNGSLNVEDVIKGISATEPGVKIGFEEAKIQKSHEWSQSPSFYNPRTLLIISIHSSMVIRYMEQLNQTLSFLSQVSVARRRPRWLIILPQEEERFAYLGLLKHMWSNQFLDVTILELEEPKGKNYFQKTKKFLAPDIATIHQFNPFTNRYDKSKYSKMVHWFPEKAHNLEGLTMKVAVINYPPFVYIRRNRRGHPITFGSDITLTKALSKAINFKVEWVYVHKDSWGIGTCNKNNESSFLKRIMNNDIQYVSVFSTRYGPCKEPLYEWTRGIKTISTIVTVPIFRKKSVLLLNIWNVVNLVMLAILFLSTWLIARMLPFQSQNWKFLQLVRIVLGTTAPNEPTRTAERIVFGAMLCSYMLHSSLIYTVLTEMSLHSETEPELKTVSSVVQSNLEPMIAKSYYSTIVKEAEGSERILLQKATQVNSMSYECLGILLKNKNVACISRSDVTEWMIQNNKDSCGRPQLKILEMPFQTKSSGIIMEARSPYVERFDKVLLRLVQSGVTNKWQVNRVNQSSLVEDRARECEESEIESSPIKREVIYLLIFGYSCAIVSFLLELLFAGFFTKRFVK